LREKKMNTTTIITTMDILVEIKKIFEQHHISLPTPEYKSEDKYMAILLKLIIEDLLDTKTRLAELESRIKELENNNNK